MFLIEAKVLGCADLKSASKKPSSKEVKFFVPKSGPWAKSVQQAAIPITYIYIHVYQMYIYICIYIYTRNFWFVYIPSKVTNISHLWKRKIILIFHLGRGHVSFQKGNIYHSEVSHNITGKWRLCKITQGPWTPKMHKLICLTLY